jgi:modulator of FtsH protease
MREWSDFFTAEVGASAALAGLLFVAVSINLGQILKFPHLPTRALEALTTLLCVLVISTFALVPGQTALVHGLEMGGTGLLTWGIQTVALTRTRESGYETFLRYFFNQVPPLPFVVGGILLALGYPSGIYWVVPGTLLCILSGVYCAWVLLVEIQR